MSTEQEFLSLEPDLEAIIEALIFASHEPIKVDKLLETLTSGGLALSRGQVTAALNKLMEKWQTAHEIGRGLRLWEAADGYIFTTNPSHSDFVQKVVGEKPVELSKAQVEVLAIIAYRQPLTRVDVDEIRGVDSSFALKRLLQLNLVKILGKSEGLGRPLLYGTTKFFLEFFALNSLRDLPALKHYDSLSEAQPPEDSDVEAPGVSLRDLFLDAQQNSMISAATARMSEEALKSLDEALLNMDGLPKMDALE
jgi:segregation and condensation protein B